MFGGTPFLAMSHTQVLYPLTWLTLPLPPHTAHGWLLWLHMVLAGIGAFAWLGAAGRSRHAALFGGMVFALNGMFATRMGHPQYIAVACWLPWILWGVEHLFKQLDGVVHTEVGYTGGSTDRPDYRSVCGGRTGHAEAVLVEFDPAAISYAEVVRYFFRLHDPTTLNRQHNDVGTQYRSAIFVSSLEQRRIAAEIVKEEAESGRWRDPVVTEVAELGPFWTAEQYHQDYLDKNPGGYNCHILRDE